MDSRCISFSLEVLPIRTGYLQRQPQGLDNVFSMKIVSYVYVITQSSRSPAPPPPPPPRPCRSFCRSDANEVLGVTANLPVVNVVGAARRKRSLSLVRTYTHTRMVFRKRITRDLPVQGVFIFIYDHVTTTGIITIKN